MRLLLDTHIYLWYVTGNLRMSPSLLPILRDPGNELLLSVVSAWEMAIKYHLGKLPLPRDPSTYVPFQRARHQIGSLDLDEASIAYLAQLPALHRDPFDRVLLCQAWRHGLTLVTQDQTLQAYATHTPIAMLP